LASFLPPIAGGLILKSCDCSTSIRDYNNFP
jgi:hypothetical protein